MAKKGKRQKIDWDNIKISVVPADKNNPNPHNPCSGLTKTERERRIVSIAARIWGKAMNKKLEEMDNSSNPDIT